MRDVRIDRRQFLRGVGGVAAGMAAATSFTACGTGTSRSAGTGTGSNSGSKTLVVRNSGGAWGDAAQKALYDPFTKETGIQIKVANTQYAQMLAQIQQGRPQFDLIDDSMADFVLFQKQKALEQLDYDRLTSFKNARIPQTQVTEYSVGRTYWASVMAYRTDAFGGAKPTSWADFWDAKKFPGARSLQSQDADLPELEFALLADGVPMDKLYPLDVDRAFKALDAIKGSVKKFWDTGALPGVLLSRQEVVMSSVWHGRLDALIKQGVPLAYQWNGARRQCNGWGIPKGTDNLDAAYKLIDFTLRPEVQAQLSKVYPVGPVVPAANDMLQSSVTGNLASSPEHLHTGFDLDVNWWIDNQDAVLKRWQAWTHV